MVKDSLMSDGGKMKWETTPVFMQELIFISWAEMKHYYS